MTRFFASILSYLIAHNNTTSGSIALNNIALSLLRPLLVIVVCPLWLPELFSLRFNPASFIICFGSLNLLISPTSARKPPTVLIPIPLIANSLSAPGMAITNSSMRASISSRILRTSPCSFN